MRWAKRHDIFTGSMVATLVIRQALLSGTRKQQHSAELRASAARSYDAIA